MADSTENNQPINAPEGIKTPPPEMTDEQAAEYIRRLLQESRATNWDMPNQYAIHAQRISRLPTASEALKEAKATIAKLRGTYEAQQIKVAQAIEVRDYLKTHPITNLGQVGVLGYLQRQLLALLNATPASLNWIEVDHNGLQIYTPLSPVSRRTVKFGQIKSGEIVLSVNPPAYFDYVLGLIRQFRRGVNTPWGEIVIYERGSGKSIAAAVAWKPDKKIDEMRRALQTIHLAENPNENFERMPRLVDLLVYVDTERLE